MYKKLVAGELSLVETFWKFGVLGSLLGFSIVWIFGGILVPQLHGYSIYAYYTQYYNPLRSGSDILLSTVCYLTSLGVFCAYLFSVVLGVWRSSAEYDKNVFFKYMSRIGIVFLAYLFLRIIF
ncbi:MAG: hypothetical protein IJ545_06630 [Alphaproteobacteria bacterium]|nr:hypothetical protein [Alphaproteobacteria bacterium]